jgi:hypothetical protein
MAKSDSRERRLPEVFHASQTEIDEMTATAMVVNCKLRFQIRSLIRIETLCGGVLVGPKQNGSTILAYPD